MFAALHAAGNFELLLECARRFSPKIEPHPPDTVIFDVRGLRSLVGSPEDIAQAITRQVGIPARLALAPNPDAAAHAARGIPGITVIARGAEGRLLAPLPINLLTGSPAIAETLDQWGVRTFGEFAQLPPLGVSARLGDEGVHLWRLARGEVDRSLNPEREAREFQEFFELEHPVDNLEPLAFLLSRMLHGLCAKLAEYALAADQLCLTLSLENAPEHLTHLRFPVPLSDPRALLKILQLDLAGHPPPAPVLAIRLAAQPAKPRVEQHGLFVPQSPEPRQMELTLARLSALVGEENVGTPAPDDSWRPDAFAMRRFRPVEPAGAAAAVLPETVPSVALRRFRPPKYAHVQVKEGKPVRLSTLSIQGQVTRSAGPWRTSGNWWNPAAWDHDEWDVELSNGGLYRIYFDRATSRWFLAGSYD